MLETRTIICSRDRRLCLFLLLLVFQCVTTTRRKIIIPWLLFLTIPVVSSMTLTPPKVSLFVPEQVPSFPSNSYDTTLVPTTITTTGATTTTMATSSTTTPTTNPLVETIDVHQYLDRIESLLRQSTREKSSSSSTGSTSSQENEKEQEKEENDHKFIFHEFQNFTSPRRRIVKRKLSEPNRKPMIRTLLGFDNKVTFDKALREAQTLVEYQRMTQFCQLILLPLLIVDDQEEVEEVEEEEEEEAQQQQQQQQVVVIGQNVHHNNVHHYHRNTNNENPVPSSSSSSSSSSLSLWKQRIPDLIERIEAALQTPPLSSSVRDGIFPFRKLSTGRYYKGQTLTMIQDLFPYSYVIDAYKEAITTPTESQILQKVCDLRSTWLYTNKANHNPSQLLSAALQLCCGDSFPNNNNNEDDPILLNNNNNNTSSPSPCPTKSGQDCERACLTFLKQEEEVTSQNHIVLSNVYVKTSSITNGGGSNTVNNKKKENYKNKMNNMKHKKNKKKNSASTTPTGIIWTSVHRDKTCSEFDVVIVNPKINRVVQVWEAKRSISPSTLWDAIHGKLSAIQQLVDDQESCLEYEEITPPTNEDAMTILNHGDNNKNISDNEDSNDAEITEPPKTTTALIVDTYADKDSSQVHDDHQYDDDEEEDNKNINNKKKIVFGVFGTELMPPESAVRQLEAIAAGKALSSSVETVLQAIQCGYVEIDRARLIFDIHVLRAKVQAQLQQYTIVVKLGSQE